MKTTRKRYTGEFKAKVALEAIRGDLTLAELAAKHGIHPTMIATWKRQAIDGMAATFSGASEAAKAAGDTESTRPASSVVTRRWCEYSALSSAFVSGWRRFGLRCCAAPSYAGCVDVTLRPTFSMGSQGTFSADR